MAYSNVNKANTVLQGYLVTSNAMIEEAIIGSLTRSMIMIKERNQFIFFDAMCKRTVKIVFTLLISLEYYGW